MSWDHGYHSRSSYSSGFYREMAPDWLDFVALLQGHRPPREQQGSIFRYLDMGCGTGFGLCVLAAAYPEGTFVGVDFQPDHVSQAIWLAEHLGLSNVRFVEADFLDLRVDPSPLGVATGYDYVAAHGIATWVVQPVQQALFAVVSAALRPGGVFYCSYNTFPGWLGRTTFQKLYSLERDRSDSCHLEQPFKKTIASLRALMGSDEHPYLLGRALPMLAGELDWIDGNSPDYLCGEFSNEGWEPLYVADLHQRCAAHKLRFIGSATLPDNFEQLLEASLQPAVLEEPNPLMRQTLIDLATNKAFRRDLFVKGFHPLTPLQAFAQLAEVSLHALEVDPSAEIKAPDAELDPFSFSTSFGRVVADPSVYGPIQAALVASPCSIGTLQSLNQLAPREMAMAVALLLDSGRIGFDRADAGGNASVLAQRVNGQLIELISEGKAFSHLVVPRLGSAVRVSVVEVLILRALQQGLEQEVLATCVLMGLEGLAIQLRSDAGSPLANSDQQLRRLLQLSDGFRQQRLPCFIRLGVLSPPG